MIYFIQDTKSRAIKIGVSSEPAQRLKQLQTAHASDLKLIAVMDGSFAEEQSLHQLFTRKRGEWFEPTRELRTFIKERTVSVDSIAPVRKSRSTVPDIFEMFKPELRGDGPWHGVARLIIYKGYSVQEITDILFADPQRSYYPCETKEEAIREIQRLVDIQNA
jgi:hypothetical protein